MIPMLYESTEKNFESGAICYLGDCLSCHVEEEQNGIYVCELVYPVAGKYFSELTEGRFIVAIHDEYKDKQPFEIRSKSAPMNGSVTFYATHISYKLSRVVLKPFTATSPTEALSKIPQNALVSIGASTDLPFTFWTNKSGTGSFKVEVPCSARSILGGTEGSILDVFGGGEYKFDKWEVKLYGTSVGRGSNTGVTIRYGKNLIDIEQDHDSEDTYDAIVPYWRGRVEETTSVPSTAYGESTSVDKVTIEDTVIMLETNPVVVRSGVTNPHPVAMDFSSHFENAPTQEQLRQAAESYLTNNQPWVPKENITIDFVQLWQTQEYAEYASLQRVGLCDKVNVYYSQLGITVEDVKVIKVVYNVLLERYDKMELGQARTNFVEQIREEYKEQVVALSSGFESVLQAEIEHATKLLSNPGNSYVKFAGIDANGNRVVGSGNVPNAQEILIMNSPDPSTATEILRINKNGIGFANNINGPYGSAWTLDGHFVADYITAGTINGNLIRAGLLSDYSGSTFVLTSDQTIQAGKAYYIRASVPAYNPTATYKVGDIARYNGTVYKCSTAITTAEAWNSSHWTTATSQDYTYVLVNTPMPVELGSYYELQTTSANYWNLETGEFKLSSTLAKVNNRTIPQVAQDAVDAQTQEFVFNKLTNNGAIQGIFMTNGELYINGTYITAGTINGNLIRTGMLSDYGQITYTLTSDSSIVTGKGYYKRSGTSPNYTYTLVGNPIVSELSTYYEISTTHSNYWNLETGEFKLSSTATLGGKTAQEIINDATFTPTQQNIFNALTNNGQAQGIYLQNGELYINASYIKSGYLEANQIKVNDFMDVYWGSSYKGTLGIGDHYDQNNNYICRGLGMSAEGTVNQSGVKGTIAIDMSFGHVDIYANGVDILSHNDLWLAADDDIVINGNIGYTGYDKVITDIQDNGDGTISWWWDYLSCRKGIVIGFT